MVISLARRNPKKLLNAIKDLERNLLPEKIDMHYNPTFEANLRRILADIRVLISEGNEIADVRYKNILVELNTVLSNYFREYQNKNVRLPKNLTVKEINKYIKTVANFFEKRYNFIYAHPSLRKTYKKLAEFQFKKRVKLIGNINLIKGPAIIAPNHDIGNEHRKLRAVINQWIFWVGDPSLWIRNWWISQYSIPLRGWYYKSCGTIRIDRKNVAKFKAPMLDKTLAVLEHGGIVGIFPEGGNLLDAQKAKLLNLKLGHKGVIFLAQQAIMRLGKKVPIIPIGIREAKEEIIIKIGEPWFIDPNGDGAYRELMSNKLIEYIRTLAR